MCLFISLRYLERNLLNEEGLVVKAPWLAVLLWGLVLVFLCSWENGSGFFRPWRHLNNKSFYSWLSGAHLFSHSPRLNALPHSHHPARKVGAEWFPLMPSGAGPHGASGPTAAASLALEALLCRASLRTAAVESGRPSGLHVGARLACWVLILAATLVGQCGGGPLAGAFSSLWLFQSASLRSPTWLTPSFSSASLDR